MSHLFVSLIYSESYISTYWDAIDEMAAPVTPKPKPYIRMGKKNTAARFPSPAYFEVLNNQKQTYQL